eukprot:gene19634-biopygen32906
MHLDTAAHCQEDGILFIPMVVEACGGAWGPAARSVWAEVAWCSAQLAGETIPFKAEQIQQSLSMILHRENARAILRRAPPASAMPAAPSPLPSAPAAAAPGPPPAPPAPHAVPR